MKSILQFTAVCMLVMGLGGSFGWGQTNSYLGLDGGFEGSSTIDNTATGDLLPRANKWVKANTNATIAQETSIVRSGSYSLKVSTTSTSSCRVWSPLMTFSASTTKWVIQYYRRAASLTYIENQTYNYRGSTESGNGTYSTVSVIDTWEKVTYSPTATTSVTQGAAGILERKISSNGDMYYDDFCMYESSTGVDNSAPNSPGAVSISNPTTSSLDVSWIAASGGVDGGGYIVVRYSSDPGTGNDPNQNGIFAVGNTVTTGGIVRYRGTSTSFTDNVGLSSSTQYWYKVYTVDKAYNYSDESTGNGTTSSLSSSSSDIIVNTSFSYPTNIDYTSFQGTSLTTGNSIEVAQFDIRDGGGSADADALSTILTAISFNVSNSGSLRRIALFDASTNVGEVAGGATASFSSLTLTAADGGTKTFSVRVSFFTSVTDNQQFSFTVSSATASGSGSGFAAGNAGGAASSTSGDNNRIEVTANNIIFDQDVSNVSIGAVMNPSPTLRAIDGNLNYDLDYAAAWSVAVTSGDATFDGTATTTGSFSAGLATLGNLVFNATGTGNKLTVTSGSFTDESIEFNVTNAQPEINIKQNTTGIASGGSYDFGNQISGTSSSAITFTIENLGTATLNLTGTPIVQKSGTNASEFTIDQTSTTSAVNASSNTTFTVTFSPASQGSKSAQLSIASDDSDENPYLINLTGAGTVSSASDITNTGSYSYTSDIDYASYQTASTLTTGNSVGVNGLTIRDGGGSADADNLSTTLTAISISTGGSTAIRTAALFDGSTNVSETAVNGGTTITFSGLSLSASDGGSKDFELRVTFQATVTDNQQITFTVTSATASTAGSGFAAANAGGAASSATGEINKIEVTASQLLFTTAPSTTACPNTNLSTPPVVTAKDANNNTDLDFEGEVTLANSGLIGMSNYQMNALAGVANFSTLQFTQTGAVTLTASASGLIEAGPTSTITISVSNVTATGATNGNAQSIVSWTNPSCYDEILIVAKAVEAVATTPSGDGSAYTANLAFGSGTGFDGGFVVYKGATSSQTVTSLTNGTTYHFTFFTRKGTNWSTGTTTTATPVYASSTSDYFRSKATGNWNATGTWESSPDGNTWGNSTLTPTTSANTVTILNGHEVTVSASVSVDQVVINSGGQITVNSGQTLTIANGTGTDMTVNGTLKSSGSLTTTGTLSFGDGGKYQDNHTSNEALPSATWHSNSTFEMIGYTTNTNIPSNTGQTFGNFVWNCTSQSANFTMASFAGGFAVSGSFKVLSTGSGTLRFTGNSAKALTVNSLIIEGGTFDLTSGSGVGTFILTGDFIMNGGILTESGSASGVIQMGGSSAQYINYSAGTISNSVNFTINGSDVILTGNTLILPNNLTINATKKLTIGTSKSLTVTGTLTNSATASGLVIKSDADGTGSLITSSSPQATAERYLTNYSASDDQKFHLISSPVAAQAIRPDWVANTPAGDVDFYKFDEVQNLWINSKLVSNPGPPIVYEWNSAFESNFTVGRGYLVSYPTIPGTPRTFAGALNSYPVGTPLTINCSYTSDNGKGWNLLGNPFPSAIDWNTVSKGDGMDAALYYYDAAIENYRYFIQLEGEDQAIGGGSRYIPAMQGFMVHAKSTGTRTVTIDNDDRVHQAQTTYYKSSESIDGSLSLKVEAGEYSDEVYVHFNSNATAHFDGKYDAYKLNSYNASVPKIYTVSNDSDELAINGLPALDENTEVPVYFKPGAEGTQALTADVSKIQATVYLLDLKTGTTQNLTQNPVYSFTSSSTDNPNRFELKFGSVGIENPVENEAVTAWYSNGILYLSSVKDITTIHIFNIQGQPVVSKTVANQETAYVSLNLPAGIYVAQLVSPTSNQSVKIIVNK